MILSAGGCCRDFFDGTLEQHIDFPREAFPVFGDNALQKAFRTKSPTLNRVQVAWGPLLSRDHFPKEFRLKIMVGVLLLVTNLGEKKSASRSIKG